MNSLKSNFPPIILEGWLGSPKLETTSSAPSNFSSSVKSEGVITTFIFAANADSSPLGESSIAIHDCEDNLSFSRVHS